MANTDFGIHINVNLTVDERTAKTCLRLVEIYLNDHDGTGIKATKQENGAAHLEFCEVRRGAENILQPLSGNTEWTGDVAARITIDGKTP
ncbi:MAG: hypothetical protein LUD84_11035 [Clostridiales bacterium]|nr:hypothetical protein [Clostridiales bacterium]